MAEMLAIIMNKPNPEEAKKALARYATENSLEIIKTLPEKNYYCTKRGELIYQYSAEADKRSEATNG